MMLHWIILGIMIFIIWGLASLLYHLIDASWAKYIIWLIAIVLPFVLYFSGFHH